MIAEVADREVEGERLRGVLQPGAASGDWAGIDSNGGATLGVRRHLGTHDEARVSRSYRGRFDVADPRNAWLNRIVAGAKGHHDGAEVRSEIVEVR